jgi:uncharacterized protein YgbK (DUF1537 family)
VSAHLERQAGLFGPLVMLADDLTGGCDAGVQFAQRGLSTKVHLGAPKIIGGDAGLTVLVTHSRRETPEQASSTVERACQWISSNGAILCFKKIDSTLQGNLGSELQTVLTNFEPRVALVAPAFPAMGRLLVNGMLQLNSNSKTGLIHLPSLLEAQGVAAVAHIDKRLLRSGFEPVVEHIQKIQQEGTRTLVVDAMTSATLPVIAISMGVLPSSIVGRIGVKI